MLINTGNISRKVLSKVLRSFDKNFERLQVDSSNIQISNVKENTYRENYNTIQGEESICNLKVLSSQNGNNKKVLSELVLVMSGWRVGEALIWGMELFVTHMQN